MRLVPLTEGGSIDLDDGTLHEGVRADEFVVRGIVDLEVRRREKINITFPRNQKESQTQTHHRDDPRLLRDVLRAPGEVARVETEGTVFGVTTTGAHGVDTLRTELGVGGLATELELPLLAVVGALGTGRRTLVS